jgi:hypothetical protein
MTKSKEVIPCGGCGEEDESKRCFGCLHYFGYGWDARKIHEKKDKK